ALVHAGGTDPRSREEAHARVDHAIRTVKVEGRVVAGQSQVRLVVRLHGAQVFPVAVEQMCLHLMAANAPREDVLAEVRGKRGSIQKLEEYVAVEQVNAHARQVMAFLALDAARLDPLGRRMQ